MKTFLLYSLLLIALGITSCTSTKGKNDLPEAIPISACDSLKIDQTFHLITWSIKDNRICFATSGIMIIFCHFMNIREVKNSLNAER